MHRFLFGFVINISVTFPFTHSHIVRVTMFTPSFVCIDCHHEMHVWKEDPYSIVNYHKLSIVLAQNWAQNLVLI